MRALRVQVIGRSRLNENWLHRRDVTGTLTRRSLSSTRLPRSRSPCRAEASRGDRQLLAALFNEMRLSLKTAVTNDSGSTLDGYICR